MTKRDLSAVPLFDENSDKAFDDITELMPERMKGESLLRVPVSLIDPDPNQPRKEYTEAELDDLHRRIIATDGITKPIDIYQNPTNPDRYLIEDGEMRWIVYSTRMNEELIPSRVLKKRSSQGDILLRQLMANFGNIDMTLLDKARGIETWRNSFDEPKTRKEAAEAFGWSQTKMSRTLKLIDAPTVIQELSRDTTNLNTLSSMIKLYKEDQVSFDAALETYQSESFSENPEKYWQEAAKSASEPNNAHPSHGGTLREDRVKKGVVNPDTDNESDRSERKEKAERSRQGKPTNSQKLTYPASETKVIAGEGEFAVLQLGYDVGKETLHTVYTLTDEKVETLIAQLQSYQAQKTESYG